MLGTSVCDLHDLDADPKNPRARRGSSKDQGAADLDLAHGELPPITGVPVGRSERSRDDPHLAVEETLHALGSKRSQMAWSRSGSSQLANPLARAL